MATLKEIVKECEKEMRCNCDLDNWEPETDTNHSWICRIHKAARYRFKCEKEGRSHETISLRPMP